MSNKQFIKLKFIAESFSSSIKQSDVQENADYPVYGASGHVGYLDTYGYDKRYIGIVKDGAGVGRTGIYEGFSSLLATLSYIIPRDETNTSLEYLKYSIDALNLEESYGEKATIPHIYFSVYGNYKILNIPHIEQKKLASYLDDKTKKIEQLISNQQQQIEKLKEYKQSLISEVVIKGLDSNVETKDSGVDWIGRVPTNTAIVQLGKIASLKTGTTPKGNVGINQEYDGINWYTPGDFTSLILSSSEKYISSSAIIDNKIKIYEKNSILFVGIGATAGKLGLSTVECYSNQQITQIYPKNIDAKYLLYFMASQTQILRDRALYTTLPIINNSYLKTIFIPVPSANDQVYICSYIENKLRQIDNLLDIKNKKIHYLNNYKKSLIYEYVTGKKEVS